MLNSIEHKFQLLIKTKIPKNKEVSCFKSLRNCIYHANNYNCHNIYWDPLIWLVENGHLIALTCISFFNEPGPYSWGVGPFRGPFTSVLLLWYCAMLLWREMDSLWLLTVYLTLTPIFSARKAKIDLHVTPNITVVMPISCLLRSIQFPSPQNDAITPKRSPLAPVLVLYVFSRAPQ